MQKLFNNILLILIVFFGFFIFIDEVKAGDGAESMCVYWIDGPAKKDITTSVSGFIEKTVENVTNFKNGDSNKDVPYATFMIFYDEDHVIEGKYVNALILTEGIIYSTVPSSVGDGALTPADGNPDWPITWPERGSFINKNGFSTCPVVGWVSKWDGSSNPQFEFLNADKKKFSDGVVKATLQSEFSRSGAAIEGLALNCPNIKGEALTACINFYSQKGEEDDMNKGDTIKCEDFTYDGVNIIKMFFSIMMIAGPILVIILGSADLAKAAIAADEQAMKKAWKNASKRLVAAILLFIIPLILTIILNLAATAGILGKAAELCLK